jgi:hypothetical protein
MATAKPASAPAPWDNPGVPPTEAAQLEAARVAQEQADAAAALAASTVPPGATAQAPAAGPTASAGAVTANTPVEVADEVTVTVTAPKPFVLNWTNDVRFEYKAGVQEMPLAHATHWWAKANGVKVYERK